MQPLPKDTGWIELICGPMFSGKTEALIHRLRRALYARQRVQVFKPRIDDRYDAVNIVSHSKQSLLAQPVDAPADILPQLEATTSVVGIDEGQFFDHTLVDVVQAMANDNRRVIIAGLDLDFTGTPFEPMPELMAVAEFVTKTLAICVVCGNVAGRTQRLVHSDQRVVVGSDDAYEARCRKCHTSAPAQMCAQLGVRA